MNVNTKVFSGSKQVIQSLDGGFSHDVNFNISAITKGRDIRGKQLINIRLDSGNAVDEENENNNGFGVSMVNQSIFPQTPCPQ